jgi:ketosteroid isomerase-like protein
MTRRLFVLAMVLMTLAGSPAARAQKQQKQQKPAPQKDAPADTTPVIPQADDQAVDTAITEMLGAWQIGDVEMLKKYLADNLLVVSGYWEPPLMGIDKYIAAYQRQRERVRGPQLNRTNTFIRVQGNVAWAVYQWVFTGEVDGQPTGYRGHTTLVFEKRNGRWLIVTNHTSIASLPQEAVPQQTPPAPAKPQ